MTDNRENLIRRIRGRIAGANHGLLNRRTAGYKQNKTNQKNRIFFHKTVKKNLHPVGFPAKITHHKKYMLPRSDEAVIRLTGSFAGLYKYY